MVTVKISGMKDVKLTAIEFDAMVQALYSMVRWSCDGMYGDGEDITDKVGMRRAITVLKKLGYGK
jgi:hypothetical protein